MFVVFEKSTTQFLRVFRNGMWQDAKYSERGGATRALNAAAKAGKIVAEDYAILPFEEFKKIEKTVIRHGIVGAEGKTFEVPVNTPWTSGPWSETYWSA